MSSGGDNPGRRGANSSPGHLTSARPRICRDFPACGPPGPHFFRVNGSVLWGWIVRYLFAKAHAIWASRDDGASAVEYGLLVAGIAALIVTVVFVFGKNLSSLFQTTCNKIVSGTCT
jgi:pilus assembly protein Flp/PilA